MAKFTRPTRWATSPSECAPKWRNHWRGIRIAVPWREGGGDFTRNYAPSGIDGTFSSHITWAESKTGHTVFFDGSSNQLVTFTKAITEDYLDWTFSFIYESVLTRPGPPAAADDELVFEIVRSGTAVDRLRVFITDDVGEVGHIRLSSDTAQGSIFSTIDLTENKDVYIVTIVRDTAAAEYRFYVDGVLDTVVTDTDPTFLLAGDGGDVVMGDIPGSTEQVYGYLSQTVWCSNQAWTTDMVGAHGADPWGMFRRSPVIIGRVPDVVAGGFNRHFYDRHIARAG